MVENKGWMLGGFKIILQKNFPPNTMYPVLDPFANIVEGYYVSEDIYLELLKNTEKY